MWPKGTMKIEIKWWVVCVIVWTACFLVVDFSIQDFREDRRQLEEIYWWRTMALSRVEMKIDEDTIPGFGIVYFEGGDKALVLPKRSGGESFFVDLKLRRLDNGKIIDTK